MSNRSIHRGRLKFFEYVAILEALREIGYDGTADRLAGLAGDGDSDVMFKLWIVDSECEAGEEESGR